jgi:NarL family two-component system sensor histidine kinase LiaS
MVIQRILSPFQRLQWKLTFSYTLITVVTIFVIEILFLSIAFIYVGANETQLFASNTYDQAQKAAPYFSQDKPNAASLTAFLRGLETANTNPLYNSPSVFLTIVDAQGNVIASSGTHPTLSNAALQAQLSAQDKANLQSALSSKTGSNSLSSRTPNMIGTTVASIVSDDFRIHGALLERRILPNVWQLYLSILPFLPRTLIPLTLFAAIPGAIFGFINARALTQRLRKLSSVADMWSQGDFSVTARDRSGDELGQMTRRFNQMAEQLQSLIETRQKLATLEERNRLARDLHDSVKQQIFAISMQVGAVKVLLGRDLDAAKKRLDETDVLVRQAQQELTTLIKELRPVALEGKGLVEAVRELMTQWMQQTGILAKLQVEGQQTLPLTVEEALFRVVQEALSNVARHSKATLVQMKLSMTDDIVTLTIDDNGLGFDSTQQKHGVGLLSMQERMKALGGDVRVESSTGKGTHVVAYCERLGVPTSNSKGEVMV